jgi:hypothetical protein
MADIQNDHHLNVNFEFSIHLWWTIKNKFYFITKIMINCEIFIISVLADIFKEILLYTSVFSHNQ